METVQLAAPEALGYRACLAAGYALLDAQQVGEAVPYLVRANELREDAVALVRLASAYRDLGHLDEAMETYERALTREGRGTTNAHARVGVAAVLLDFDDLASDLRAVELLGTVVVAEPKNAGAWWTLKRAYEQSSRRTGEPGLLEQVGFAKKMAEACDDRSSEERRDEQRLRAVSARSRVLITASSASPIPPEPESPTAGGDADSEPPASPVSDPREGWLARRVRRWIDRQRA